MTQFYTIDRFEGTYAILLDFDTGEKQWSVKRDILPADASEGDVLKKENDHYLVDAEKTAEALAEAKALLEAVCHD